MFTSPKHSPLLRKRNNDNLLNCWKTPFKKQNSYNIICKDKCECLKIFCLEQSAAKLLIIKLYTPIHFNKIMYEEEPCMKFYMNEIQTPIYLNSNFIYDPTAFSLSHYKERSMFQSNVIEFWAPVTN